MTESTPPKGIVESLIRLTVIFGVAWCICFWPARMLRPEEGVWWMSVACLVSLIPGWLIIVLECLPWFRGSLNKLIFGQMSIRFLFVLAACAGIRIIQPQLGLMDFYLWLLIYYLVAMVVEVMLLREKLLSIRTQESNPDVDQTSHQDPALP